MAELADVLVQCACCGALRVDDRFVGLGLPTMRAIYLAVATGGPRGHLVEQGICPACQVGLRERQAGSPMAERRCG